MFFSPEKSAFHRSSTFKLLQKCEGKLRIVCLENKSVAKDFYWQNLKIFWILRHNPRATKLNKNQMC